MVLDTAAGVNVLTPEAAAAIKVAPRPAAKPGGAAGLGTQAHPVTNLTPVTLSYGKSRLELDDLAALDLSHVEHAGGKEGLDGLLGSPFFRAYQATIDFARNELSLPAPEEPNAK